MGARAYKSRLGKCDDGSMDLGQGHELELLQEAAKLWSPLYHCRVVHSCASKQGAAVLAAVAPNSGGKVGDDMDQVFAIGTFSQGDGSWHMGAVAWLPAASCDSGRNLPPALSVSKYAKLFLCLVALSPHLVRQSVGTLGSEVPGECWLSTDDCYSHCEQWSRDKLRGFQHQLHPFNPHPSVCLDVPFVLVAVVAWPRAGSPHHILLHSFPSREDVWESLSSSAFPPPEGTVCP